MATRLVHMVIDAHDTSRLAQFWAAALGWEVGIDDPAEASVWPGGFEYPGPGALPLVFVPVPEPEAKVVKNRIHLDLATQSVAHQEELVRRVRHLGAVPVDIGQGDVPWAVLADPEGNEFCVLEPGRSTATPGPLPLSSSTARSRLPSATSGWWPAGGA